MPGIRRLVVALAAAACSAALAAPTALAVYPNSMAATGDSITKAFNSCAPAFRDCPANSWATGTNAAVDSFYSRILAANPAIRGNLFNDARSGAEVEALPSQVARASEQSVEYVTIAIGANDACGVSEAAMTPVADFQASFQAAIDLLRTRLPGARISVTSIPNVHYLWRILHTDPAAVATWESLDVCQSMLANAASTSRADAARRNRVLTRIVEYNTVLSNVCAAYAQCRYDRGAGFGYRFAVSEISTNDYFHPSVTGQAAIADLEWGATWVF
ncbi:MAG: SGNH/GDSL hydrolase family protein [Conexibacter sp.]